MKNYFKNTWYMYAVVFAFCFMLFIYEPLMLYLNNISDFWFSFGLMFSTTGLLFLIVFITMIITFNVIYLLNKEKSKKIFKISLIVLFIVFLCSYIQGNFLAGNLPVLDGSKINWSDYKLDWIISIVLWIVVIVGIVFAIKKLSLEKTVKYSGYVSGAILLMLVLSLVTGCITSDEALEKNYSPVVTFKNIDNYSTDKNLIVLVLDQTDSVTFMERLNKDKNFKDMLNDFTYYPDTMSGHAYTRESIPLLLTGQVYKNEEPINDWSSKAYKNSSVFEMLEKNNYELDIYSSMLFYYDETASRISNVYDSINNNSSLINKMKFYKQELKYIAFKYAPSFLKRFSKIEKMSFDMNKITEVDSKSDEIYDQSNYTIIQKIRNDEIVKVDNKLFKFIHANGSHTPYLYDKNYKEIENGTYNDAVDSSLTLTLEYLNMLKENGVYDNSAIIITSDHGNKSKTTGELRNNPILFIKGVNEKGSKMSTSNKPIHQIDFVELYEDLVNDKQNKELFSNVPDTRERYYLHCTLNTKDRLKEYVTTGHVWEQDKMERTGKVYSR